VPSHYTYHLYLKFVNTITSVSKDSYLIYVVPYIKVHLSANLPPSFLLKLAQFIQFGFFFICTSIYTQIELHFYILSFWQKLLHTALGTMWLQTAYW